MITRLLDAHHAQVGGAGDAAVRAFWLRELRTPVVLIDVARSAPDECRALVGERPLLAHTLADDTAALAIALREEEDRERAADQATGNRSARNSNSCDAIDCTDNTAPRKSLHRRRETLSALYGQSRLPPCDA